MPQVIMRQHFIDLEAAGVEIYSGRFLNLVMARHFWRKIFAVIELPYI
jgi:hypothetical protein